MCFYMYIDISICIIGYSQNHEDVSSLKPSNGLKPFMVYWNNAPKNLNAITRKCCVKEVSGLRMHSWSESDSVTAELQSQAGRRRVTRRAPDAT